MEISYCIDLDNKGVESIKKSLSSRRSGTALASNSMFLPYRPGEAVTRGTSRYSTVRVDGSTTLFVTYEVDVVTDGVAVMTEEVAVLTNGVAVVTGGVKGVTDGDTALTYGVAVVTDGVTVVTYGVAVVTDAVTVVIVEEDALT